MAFSILNLLTIFIFHAHYVISQHAGQGNGWYGNDQTPICLDLRGDGDPSAGTLGYNVNSSRVITRACDKSAQSTAQTPWAHTFVSILDFKWFFNTSLENVPTTSNPDTLPVPDPTAQDCPNTFNAIILSCVSSQSFWGGWQVVNSINYSSECTVVYLGIG